MAPRTLTAEIVGISPYSSSRAHDEPKLNNKESPDAYELRTWRERTHYDASGQVFIPAMAFKFSMMDAAASLGVRIKGKGQATYTKRVTNGILITENVYIGCDVKDAHQERVYCHANGQRGSGKRVYRYYPTFAKWSGTLVLTVINDELPNEIVEQFLREAGNFVGVGRFRPANGGFLGRFEVTKCIWAEAKIAKRPTISRELHA